MSVPTEPQRYKILAYRIEGKGNIRQKKYEVFFDPNEAARFQEFDGVIVFQPTFESFEPVERRGSRYLAHKWDRDRLDKRTKETLSLVQAGGFVCFLLTDPLIDSTEYGDYRETDLAKRMLMDLDRSDFSRRNPNVSSKVNELKAFFETHGAAWSCLSPRHGDPDCKILGTTGRYPVSVVVNGCIFAIPTLMPASINEVEEYFKMLTDSLGASKGGST